MVFGTASVRDPVDERRADRAVCHDCSRSHVINLALTNYPLRVLAEQYSCRLCGQWAGTQALWAADSSCMALGATCSAAVESAANWVNAGQS